MKYLPLALALLSTPAASQTLCDVNPTLAVATGLGDGGYACHGVTMTAAAPVERVTLITGNKPGPVIEVTVDTHSVMHLRSDGSGKYTHAVCSAMPSWTMPWYALGLPIPEWPLAFLDQSADDNGSIIAGNSTATIRIRTLDALHGLEPNSNYSLNIICPPRTQ